MNQRIKVLFGILVMTALGASYSVNARLTGQVASPMHVTIDQFAECLRMDVDRNGFVEARDANIIRAELLNPNGMKDCWNLTGEALNACKAMDVHPDNIIDIMDYITARQYQMNPDALKACNNETPDTIAVCQLMDVTRDGLVNYADEITVRISGAQYFGQCDDITDPSDREKCVMLDVTQDGVLDGNDHFAVRMHTLASNTLKECLRPDADAKAICASMDANQDGSVNISDEVRVQQFIANPNAPETCTDPNLSPLARENCDAADVNDDGIVNGLDYQQVKYYWQSTSSMKECPVVQSSSSSSSSVDMCAGLHSTDLMTEMNYQIDSRVNDIEATSTTTSVWTRRGTDSNPWERNTNAWVMRGDKPLDLTGSSPWNSYGTWRQAGTLISPRHIVYAYHYKIPVGKNVGFVDNQNNLHIRTLVAAQHVPETDIMIGLLDSDVPSSVSHYPVVSRDDMLSYLEPLKPGMVVPKLFSILVLNQRDRAIVSEAYQLGEVSMTHAPYRIKFSNPDGSFSYKYPNNTIRPLTHRDTFDYDLATGDSGDGGFFLINNKLVLALTHTSTRSGPFYGGLINEVNQVMTELGGGYQVTTFDLSCFTKP